MPILLILKQDDGTNKGRLKAFQTAFVGFQAVNVAQHTSRVDLS